MPTVIGVNQVSGKISENKWYNDFGRMYGRTQEKAVDALLAVLTGGAAQGGQEPIQTPGSPGSLRFPSGASTTTSPAEMEQIRKLGGVPTTDGSIMPVGRPGATQPDGVNYVPPPPVNIEDAKYLKTLNEIDPNSPVNLQRQAIASLYSQYGAGTPGGAPVNQPLSSQAPQQSTVNQGIMNTADLADQGDPEAMRVMDYLLRNANTGVQ